jgi:hypothetical protein
MIVGQGLSSSTPKHVRYEATPKITVKGCVGYLVGVIAGIALLIIIGGLL